MKIKITLKSPDAIHDAVQAAVISEMPDGLEGADFRHEVTTRMNELFYGPLHKWIVHKEYLTVEIDTDAGTARVCEQG